MNTRQLLIGTTLIGSVAALGYMAYYAYSDQPEPRPKKNPDIPVPTKRPATPPSVKKAPVKKKPATVSPPQADEFPLRRGSKGKRVERLQVWLMRNYGRTGKITGVLGPATEQHMLRYLKTRQLDKETYYRLRMDKPVHEQPIIR